MVCEEKIGIYGGSFDPIHHGHLIIATQLAEELSLDKVIIIPNYRSPLKNSTSATARDRVEMVRLAIKDNPLFELSEYEVEQNRECYTIDTLKYISEKYTKAKIYLLLGMDSWQNICSWKDYQKITHFCEVVVALRNGSTAVENSDITAQIIKTPIIEISSTEIRDKIKNNKRVSFLLPKSVETYIIANGLYRYTQSEKVLSI